MTYLYIQYWNLPSQPLHDFNKYVSVGQASKAGRFRTLSLQTTPFYQILIHSLDRNYPLVSYTLLSFFTLSSIFILPRRNMTYGCYIFALFSCPGFWGLQCVRWTVAREFLLCSLFVWEPILFFYRVLLLLSIRLSFRVFKCLMFR